MVALLTKLRGQNQESKNFMIKRLYKSMIYEMLRDVMKRPAG